MDLRRRNLEPLKMLNNEKVFYAEAKKLFLCQFNCRLENEIMNDDSVEYCVTNLNCPIRDLCTCTIKGLRLEVNDGRILAVFTKTSKKKPDNFLVIAYLFILVLTIFYIVFHFKEYVELISF